MISKGSFHKGSLNIAQFISNVDTSKNLLSLAETFENWEKSSQQLNISMNELFQILN